MSGFLSKLNQWLWASVRKLTGHGEQRNQRMAPTPFVVAATATAPGQQGLGTMTRRRSRSAVLAARLASVSRCNGRTAPRRPKPVGKARANLKPKPVVIGAKAAKRSPGLYPTKVARHVAKRASTRIYIQQRAKPSAEIIPFPVRKPLPASPRLKRVA